MNTLGDSVFIKLLRMHLRGAQLAAHLRRGILLEARRLVLFGSGIKLLAVLHAYSIVRVDHLTIIIKKVRRGWWCGRHQHRHWYGHINSIKHATSRVNVAQRIVSSHKVWVVLIGER